MYKLKMFLRRCALTRKLYVWLFKQKNRKKRAELQMCHKELSQAVFDAFEASGYEYAYASGSLLGLIRDKKFMEHDDDIDLMIVVDDYSDLKDLEYRLRPYNFTLDHFYKVGNDIVEYTFAYKDLNVTVDVFAYKRNGDSLFSCWLFQNTDENYETEYEQSVSNIVFEDIKSFEYLNYWGVKLRIPSNYESILVSNYGDKWMIKDPNYSVKNAPGFRKTNLRGFKVVK